MKQALLACAVLLAMYGGGVRAQDSVTTEKSVTTENADGSVTTQHTKTTSYVTRTETAYRTVGIPAETIVRLRDYDNRIIDARRRNDIARVRDYYTAEERLLTPDQIRQVRVYLKGHPVSDSTLVTTWEQEPVVTKEVKTEVHPATEVRTEVVHPATEVRVTHPQTTVIEKTEPAAQTETTVKKETTVERSTE